MRIEQLRYFVEVAHRQSIKAASAHLFLAQQSVSQTIKNLEKELGFLLLNRTTTGITLTEEGKLFVEFAERVLAEQAEFFQKVEQLQHQADEKLYGTLQFHIFGLYNICVLPEMLTQFCLRYPNVAIDTAMMNLPDIEHSFAVRKEALIGMITLPEKQLTQYAEHLQQQGLKLLPFAKSRYFLCCNKEHKLLRKKLSTINLEDAMQYPIVQYSVDKLETDTLHKLLAQYGYAEKKYALSVQSIHAWAANLLRGDRIGFLNELIFADVKEKNSSFQDIVAVSTTEPLTGVLACIVRQDTSELAEKFIDLLPKMAV